MDNLNKKHNEEILNDANIFMLELSYTLPQALETLKQELNPKQQEYIGKFASEGLIYVRWNDDIPHQDYQELAFTIFGNLAVFKIQYAEELNIFKNYLLNHNYDYSDSLIDNFLISSDLKQTPEKILTIGNLVNYSNTYDIYIGK